MRTKDELLEEIEELKKALAETEDELSDYKTLMEFKRNCDKSAKQLKVAVDSYKEQGFSEEFIQQLILGAMKLC